MIHTPFRVSGRRISLFCPSVVRSISVSSSPRCHFVGRRFLFPHATRTEVIVHRRRRRFGLGKANGTAKLRLCYFISQTDGLTAVGRSCGFPLCSLGLRLGSALPMQCLLHTFLRTATCNVLRFTGSLPPFLAPILQTKTPFLPTYSFLCSSRL